METNIVIYIGIYKFIGTIGTLVVLTWWASHRLTKVETKVDMFETRLTGMEGRLDASFGSGSPLRLLTKGETILNESGLKKYIDDNKAKMLSDCQSGNTMTNQYDIQEAVFKFFDGYDFGDFESALKSSAFKYGVTLETIRRIAGIYFRDICLADHGFKPEDLDT
jgi:hypothetical protein